MLAWSVRSPEDMEVTMRAYWAWGYQIHVHTNGDLAMQVVVRSGGGLVSRWCWT